MLRGRLVTGMDDLRMRNLEITLTLLAYFSDIRWLEIRMVEIGRGTLGCTVGVIICIMSDQSTERNVEIHE